MAKHLKVLAKRDGFRRAGFGFSDKAATYIPLDKLEKEQLAALRAEPQLLVSEEDPPAEPKNAKAKDGAAT